MAAEYPEASSNSSIELIVAEKFQKLTTILINRGITIATMESCTSGLIASCVSDIPGSSAVLKGGFVTYCNEAKILNGVPEEVILKYGVYSVETAKAMAAKCKQRLKSDIGIGITGTFSNPDPSNTDSMPGEVYFAIAYFEKIYVFQTTLKPEKCRHIDKLAAASLVCDELLKLLEKN